MAVRVESNLRGGRGEAKSLDSGRELHAVVRGTRVARGELRDFARGDLADDGGPAAGAVGIAQAGAIGEDDVVLFLVGDDGRRRCRAPRLGRRAAACGGGVLCIRFGVSACGSDVAGAGGAGTAARRWAAVQPLQGLADVSEALELSAGVACGLFLAFGPAGEDARGAAAAHGIDFGCWHGAFLS